MCVTATPFPANDQRDATARALAAEIAENTSAVTDVDATDPDAADYFSGGSEYQLGPGLFTMPSPFESWNDRGYTW